MLSAALVFTGLTPAVADDAATPPDPAATQAATDQAATDAPTPTAAPTDPAPPAEPAPTEPAPTEPAPTEEVAPTEDVAPTEEEAPEQTAPANRMSTDSATTDVVVGPMAVPNPSTTSSVITVKVGSDRTGLTGVTNLAGVTLLLNGGTNAPNGVRPDGVAGTGDGWAKCVSDVQGDCSFTVPNTNTGGAQRNTRPWVVQAAVPAGYYTNPTLRVGGASGDGDALAYRFRLKVGLVSNTTYSSQDADDLMLASGNVDDASGGIWQQSRFNPALNPSCGLDVALILDISGSVGADLPNLKTAANTFVDALVGTPSRMSLFSFSWQTPGAGASTNYPSLTSVSAQSQANAFKALYSGWTSSGGTNWDRGLGAAAEANTGANQFDVAVIITDGNPTTYNQPYQGTGSDNRFRETENGIFSANAIKAKSRLIAFGVGAGANGANTALNLRSISGTVPFNGSNAATADYYQTSNYAAVGTALRNLALGNCSGNLTVTKQIVPGTAPVGSIAGAVPSGAGWNFNATTGSGVTTPVANRVTPGDGTGTVAYPLTFSGGVTSGAVTVTETQQSGYSLTQVAGQNAVCKNLNTNASVPVNNSGALGFTVNVPSTQAVNCVVYNRAPNPAADVTVSKKWVVNGQPYAEGAQPAGLSAQLSLTGPGAAGATAQGWGVTRTGYSTGQSVTLSESVTTIDPTMCTNVATVTEVNGATTNVALGAGYTLALPNAKNTATITNTVTCKSTLTLVKRVEGGTAAPTAWTLKAMDTSGATVFSGASGAAAVTNIDVTPDARYQLGETGGSALYTQVDNRTNFQSNPASTGSATCIRVNANGTPYEGSGFSDGINGGVNVPLGFRVACTLVNQTASLTLLKTVVNDNGGTATASAWNLTATAATPPTIAATTVVGAETAAAANTFNVRPRHTYTLTESTTAGYQFQKLQQLVGGSWVDVVANASPTGFPRKDGSGNWLIQVAPVDTATYRFVNDDIAPTLTLKKRVVGLGGTVDSAATWTLTAQAGSSAPVINQTGTSADGGVTATTSTVAVRAGVGYALSESASAGYTPGAWSCVGGTLSGSTVTLGLAQNATCEITNTQKPASLTVVKKDAATNTDLAGATFTLWKDVNGDGALQTGTDTIVQVDGSNTFLAGSKTIANLPWGKYLVQEVTPPAGYDLSNPVVQPVTLGASQTTTAVVVTFANPRKAGSVSWTKVDGSTLLAGSAWTLTPSNPAGAVIAVTDNTGQPGYSGRDTDPAVGKFTVGGLTWGTYTLAETQAPVGYEPTTSTPSVTITSTNLAVSFGAINNVKKPTLTLVKKITNADGSAGELSQFPLTARGAGVAVIDGATSGTPAATAVVTAGTSYTLSEAAPTGWAQVGQWSCVVTTSGGAQAPQLVTSITLVSGTSAVCTVTNAPTPVDPTVAKKVDSVTHLAGGSYQVIYTVSVTQPATGAANPLGLSSPFELKDTPQFGAGITVTGVQAGPAGGTLTPRSTSGEFTLGSGTVAAGSTVAYTVVVTAQVAAGVIGTSAADCTLSSQERGTGFLNTVDLYRGETVIDDADVCATPTTPKIDKSATSSVYNPANDTWTVTYTITVNNTAGTNNSFYSLTDSPAFSTNVVGPPTVTPAAGTPALGSGLPTFTGGILTIVPTTGTVSVPAGATHTYSVAFVVDVSTWTDEQLEPCTEGGGFINTANLTVDKDTTEDSACGEVGQHVDPSLTKTVTSNVQNADGTWTTVYSVVVTQPAQGASNPSGLSGRYTLNDDLRFGDNLDIVSASWTSTGVPTSPSGAWTAPNWTTPQLMALGRLIQAGVTHTYTVSVVSNATTAAFEGETYACTPGEESGFLNAATLTIRGVNVTPDSEACAEPSFPTITKVAGTPSAGADSSWNIFYTVTVSNPGTGPLTAVSLTDAFPAAPTGWTYQGNVWSVVEVGSADPAATFAPGTTGTIWSGALAVDETRSFTVSAVLVPTASATPLGACTTGGITNTATVTSGAYSDDQSDCLTVTLPPVTIQKDDGVATQGADGVWTIRYKVSVTNASTTLGTVYSLTDTPQFDASFAAGPGAWEGSPNVTNVAIPANTTQTYYYVVTATSVVTPTPASGLTCTPGQGGGFYNSAKITFPGGSATDTGCAQPSVPTVTKTGKPAVQTSATSWTLSYSVVVTNTSGTTLSYTVTDTPAALPAGVTGGAWTATGPTAVGGGTGALTAGWTGTAPNAQLATGLIPNGATHTYTVSRTVTLSNGVDPANLVCNPQTPRTGFWNTATITNGVGGNDSSACVTVTPPKVSVEKSDATISQGADLVWTLAYDVTVTNESATASAAYSLSDTPQFDAAFEVVAGSGYWTASGSTTPATPTGTLTPSGTATWTYHVQATRDESVDDVDSALECTSEGSTPGGGFYNTATVSFPGGTDTDAGCGEPASPTVTKTAAAAVYSGGTWQLSYTVTVMNGSDLTLGYSAVDDAPATLPAGVTLATGWAVSGPADLAGGTATLADPAWSGSGEFATGTLLADTSHVYTVTASVTLAADIDTGVLRCSEQSGIWNETLVTNGLVDDQAEACTKFEISPVTVDKTATQVQQLTDGNWQVDYEITVTNAGTTPAPYTLADTPKPDTSFTIVSQGWEGTAPGAEVAEVGTPDVWNYRVVVAAKAAPDFDEATATVCAENEDGTSGSGGFYNTVTVTYTGGTDSADACAVPIKPSVTKSGSAAQNADGTWTVTYTVDVRNDDPAKIALAYTLDDIAASVPSGAEQVGDWSVTPTATITGGGDADTATVDTDWNGSGALGFGYIGAGAAHTYTVAATYAVLATADPEALACGQEGDGGFQNSATVTNGIGESTDDACVSIEVPGVTVTKTETSTVLEADGRWKITYDVVVTGDAELVATYSLSDTLTFGGDIAVDTAASGWTGPTGTGSFGASTTAQLATDEPIAAGATHTYTVTAYATVDQEAFEGDTLTCEPSGTLDAGGFLNVASVTAAGSTTTADDCSEPGFPTITKQAQSVTQVAGDPDQYDVTYLLTVTGGTRAGYYDLTDTPAFSDDIALVSGTATQTAPTAGEPVDITSGEPFATGVAIAAGAVHTWTVTWRVEPSDTIEPDELTCGEGPGRGLFNTGIVTFGEVTQDDSDCIPLTPKVYPTIQKTVTAKAQDAATGQWTITYDVAVNLASNEGGLAAKYDLTDTLQFGGDIDVDSAAWSGQGRSGTFTDGEATLATGVTIASGATHTYTVTVKADVTAAALEGETTTCQQGEEGPEAGGFLNTALLTSGGRSTPADDCAEPQFPTVEKTLADVVDNEDGSQTISYLVEVTAPAPTEGEPVSNLGYTLTESPDALPTGVELVGDWTAEAVDPADLTIDEPTWNGEGDWTVVAGAEFAAADRTGEVTHTYRISATVQVTEVPAEYRSCDEGDTGIGLFNSVEVSAGDYTDSGEACGSVDWDDVTIAKTSELPEGQTSVEPGDSFDYVLTVTNNGTRAASDVQVTDDGFNERLEITGLSVSGGVSWSPAPGYADGKVDLTIASLAVGQSVEVRVTVVFTAAEVGEDAEPVDTLTNTACVDSGEDGTPDCDDNEITVRDITVSVVTTCQSDAAVLGWTVRKSESLRDLPINLTWLPTSGTPATQPASVELSAPGGTLEWTSSEPWPGAAFTPGGIAIDYPGWRAIVAEDIVRGTATPQYYLPGTDTIMTPEQQSQYVYNGLILDPSELDFAWRQPSTVTFAVNPEVSTTVTYPAATADCVQARHSTVEIEKTASVAKAMPGDPFTYTLDVKNVSDDSAADGVVVTDAIPSTIKVTSITWDKSAFPTWDTCAVTGQNSTGFGGTLTCTLFGPLQPTGENGSVAPQITLGALISKTAPAGVITNTAVVDYHTFGDPDDAGRDADDAVVLVSLLPATGGTTPMWLMWTALLSIVGGVGAVVFVTRRRRGERTGTL